jgi:putative endonuclease
MMYKMYFAYILRSLKDNRYYYGSCEDLEKRLFTHNAGKVRSTKSRIPFVIHYHEKHATRSEAQKREYFFKSIDGYNWLKVNKVI